MRVTYIVGSCLVDSSCVFVSWANSRVVLGTSCVEPTSAAEADLLTEAIAEHLHAALFKMNVFIDDN